MKPVLDVEQYRSLLIGLSYRIVGCMGESEDIAQETIYRWSQADTSDIQNPKAWLCKVATRLALDYLKSAKAKREQYVGTWLPEPFIEEHVDPSDKSMELDQTLSTALLLVLERLNPMERSTFILHDVFGYKYEEIAEIIDTNPTNCRQLLSRSKKKLQSNQVRLEADTKAHSKLTTSFLVALKTGCTKGLTDLFSEDVKLYSDGGGKVIAAKTIIEGQDLLIRFFTRNICSRMGEGNRSIDLIWYNGAPGLVFKEKGKTITAMSLEIQEGKISKIFSLRNPDKLKFFDVMA